MKKIRMLLGVLLAVFCGAALPAAAAENAAEPETQEAKADMLDQLEGMLDRLEPRFWSALQMSPDSPGYREDRDLVLEVGSLGRRIQQVVTRSGNRDLPNITGSLVSLQNLFSQTRRAQAQAYRFRFLRTGMAQFEREYRRLASQRGEKLPRNAKPTLANVPYDDYATWLADVCNKNLDNFSRSGRGRGERQDDRQDDNMREKVDEFFTAYRTIRLGLVKLRRSGLEF